CSEGRSIQPARSTVCPLVSVIDNTAKTLFSHMRYCGFQQIKDTIKVSLNHLMPLVLCIIQQFFAFKNERAGIVNEVVNAAVLLDSFTNQTIQVLFLHHICPDNMQSVFEPGQIPLNFHCFIYIASIRCCNIVACGKECFRNLPSQSSCSRRDEY